MAILAIFHEQNGYFDKFQSGHPAIDFDRLLTGDDDDDDDNDNEPTKEQCKKYITQACPKGEKGKTPFVTFLINFNANLYKKLQFL